MSDEDIGCIYLLSTVLHHSRLIMVILWKERYECSEFTCRYVCLDVASFTAVNLSS